jgi:hypothetical protein
VAATGGVAPGSATAPAASHAYAAAAAPALAPAASSAPAAGAPGAARATGAAAMPRGPLPPGSTIELRLAASGPSAGTAALAAMLVGRTPSGQGILDAAAGRMIVPLPAPLAGAAPGTRLTLEVVAWHAARGGADGAAQRAREADVVRPIADALAAIARASHGKVDTHDALPRPGPRLAQQLADTAAALATGRVADWLGRPAVETLERQGQGEMVRRLEQDLYQAAHGAPQTQDWRSLILPFMVGDTLRPLRFYVRQRHERARDRRQGTRFVVECEHDGLGTLQLDGMVQAKRIDLVLRSLGAVPARMQGDLTALFGDACGVMGYSGTLAFQAVPALPAMPRAEPAAGTVGVTA